MSDPGQRLQLRPRPRHAETWSDRLQAPAAGMSIQVDEKRSLRPLMCSHKFPSRECSDIVY